VRGYPALVYNNDGAGNKKDTALIYNNCDTGDIKDTERALHATPLRNENYGVDLVLFPSKTQSDTAHRGGVRRLLELTLGKDLDWMERDLSFPKQVKVMIAPFGNDQEFISKLYNMICDAVLDFEDAPRSGASFDKLVIKTKESLRGIGFRVITVLEESLRIFTENASRLASSKSKIPPDIAKELTDDLNGYFKDILAGQVPLDIFLQYPRYLRTSAAMIEKAAAEPFKYRQKRAEASQYQLIYDDLRKKDVPQEQEHVYKRSLNALAQMIREYNVSLFAQHIKTLYPISEKRLDKKIEEIKKCGYRLN
jgi:ATP-dependent helicase HrpA